jgi:hypothetical protein
MSYEETEDWGISYEAMPSKYDVKWFEENVYKYFTDNFPSSPSPIMILHVKNDLDSLKHVCKNNVKVNMIDVVIEAVTFDASFDKALWIIIPLQDTCLTMYLYRRKFEMVKVDQYKPIYQTLHMHDVIEYFYRVYGRGKLHCEDCPVWGRPLGMDSETFQGLKALQIQSNFWPSLEESIGWKLKEDDDCNDF